MNKDQQVHVLGCTQGQSLLPVWLPCLDFEANWQKEVINPALRNNDVTRTTEHETFLIT